MFFIVSDRRWPAGGLTSPLPKCYARMGFRSVDVGFASLQQVERKGQLTERRLEAILSDVFEGDEAGSSAARGAHLGTPTR